MSGQGNPRKTIMTIAGTVLIAYGLYRLLGQISYAWRPEFS